MSLSTPGLITALIFLLLGLAQWAFLKKTLAGGLEAQRGKLSAGELAEKQAGHAKLLKAVLALDVLVLPVMGYTAGRMIFSS